MTEQREAASLLLQRKFGNTLLAFSWWLGIICGIVGYAAAGNSLYLLMRNSPYGTMSIVGLLGVSILPFLFSAFAVSISFPLLLYPICFSKAFLFSFVSFGVLHSYAGAGWLIRWLLLFSDTTGVPLLYCFWLRHLPGFQKPSLSENVLFLVLFLVLGCIDYCIISPFLARLIFP